VRLSRPNFSQQPECICPIQERIGNDGNRGKAVGDLDGGGARVFRKDFITGSSQLAAQFVRVVAITVNYENTTLHQSQFSIWALMGYEVFKNGTWPLSCRSDLSSDNDNRPWSAASEGALFEFLEGLTQAGSQSRSDLFQSPDYFHGIGFTTIGLFISTGTLI
jgi:hypothetical protein